MPQFLGLDGLPNECVAGVHEAFLMAVQQGDSAAVAAHVADGTCSVATAEITMNARGMVYESESFENEVEVQTRSEPAAEASAYASGAGPGNANLEVLSVRDRLTSLAAKILSQRATVAMLRSKAEACARTVTALEAATVETAAAKVKAGVVMQTARRDWLQLAPNASHDQCL